MILLGRTALVLLLVSIRINSIIVCFKWKMVPLITPPSDGKPLEKCTCSLAIRLSPYFNIESTFFL